MSNVQEKPQPSYSERVNSCASTYLSKRTGVGSGGLQTQIGNERDAVYDRRSAHSIARFQLDHTGSGLGQGKVVYFVFQRTATEALAPQPSAPTIRSVVEMIQSIRTAFGLTITQVANVMKVERVTIYDWIATDSMDKLRPSSRDRLKVLNEIALAWESKAPLYGKFLQEQLPEGNCVFDLLRSERLNLADFSRAYEVLVSTRSSADRKQIQAKLQKKANQEIGVALRNAFTALSAQQKGPV